jgi:hypothetical protein
MSKIQKLKKTEIPCLDEINIIELQNLVEELKQEAKVKKNEDAKEDDHENTQIDSNPQSDIENNKLYQSTLNLFDSL